MGRVGRILGVFAVAAILLASLIQGYEPGPVFAVAAPASGGETAAAVDHPAAAQDRKNNRKRDRKRRGGNNKPKSPVVSDGTTCMSIGVPAYFDVQTDWDRMNADAPATGLIVLNPESGPDVAYNQIWDERTRAAQAAGIEVMGYVRTGLAKRDQGLVKEEVRTYFDWYNVDGIFLDETSSNVEDLGYYRQLADFVHAEKPSAKVVVNPGWSPDKEMMSFVDIVVTFEHDYANYVGRDFPDWTKNYAAKRFMHVVYGVPDEAAARETLELVRKHNAGYVYVTDVVDPNRVFKTLGGNLWDLQVNEACA